MLNLLISGRSVLARVGSMLLTSARSEHCCVGQGNNKLAIYINSDIYTTRQNEPSFTLSYSNAVLPSLPVSSVPIIF